MAELVLTGIDEWIQRGLEERAGQHGRTAAEEAKAILANAVRRQAAWAAVDRIHAQLLASGRSFNDSADSIREDRDR